MISVHWFITLFNSQGSRTEGAESETSIQRDRVKARPRSKSPHRTPVVSPKLTEQDTKLEEGSVHKTESEDILLLHYFNFSKR